MTRVYRFIVNLRPYVVFAKISDPDIKGVLGLAFYVERGIGALASIGSIELGLALLDRRNRSHVVKRTADQHG